VLAGVSVTALAVRLGWGQAVLGEHDGQMTTANPPELRSVLAKGGYRRLFAARTISRWGDTMNTLALVVLVFRFTGSGLGVSGAVIRLAA